MEHLKGNLQGAYDYYNACLERLRPGDNLRAQSIYLKHKADIMLVMGEYTQASMLIRSSRSLAEAGVFPELVANARLSEGHSFFRAKEAVKARMEYDAVLREAQRMKAHKLEVRALTALARLALDQKDVSRAHDYAIQSLRLSNELGLGLRQTHSLVVLGLTTLEEGQRDLGVAYLRHAKRLADKQEYWARSREAEDRLLELDVDPDGTEYPPRSVTGLRK
jgi:ATP/maltotriose-dependent transcriptional regulator MalT